jgi:hypothetical protein
MFRQSEVWAPEHAARILSRLELDIFPLLWFTSLVAGQLGWFHVREQSLRISRIPSERASRLALLVMAGGVISNDAGT